MGASGIGPFDNDGALDFCDALRESGQDGAIEFIESTFTQVSEVPEEEYLERDAAEAAVAAAALIQALRSGRGDILAHYELTGIVPVVSSGVLVEAQCALRRVLSENSEVYELWVESGGGDKWRSGVEELISNLAD